MRAKIIKRNLRVIQKNLFITEQQCLPRIIRVYHDGEEYTRTTTYKLRDFRMVNNNEITFTVRFVRALAVLSEEEITDLKNKIHTTTRDKYSDELIMQAINMAPECKYD